MRKVDFGRVFYGDLLDVSEDEMESTGSGNTTIDEEKCVESRRLSRTGALQIGLYRMMWLLQRRRS